MECEYCAPGVPFPGYVDYEAYNPAAEEAEKRARVMRMCLQDQGRLEEATKVVKERRIRAVLALVQKCEALVSCEHVR